MSANDGHGNFTAQQQIVLNRNDIVAATFGDVNNDGVPDLEMICQPGTGQYGNDPHVYDHVSQPSVWAWLGDGYGGFRPSTPVPVPLATADVTNTSISLADLDGDGYLDLLLIPSTGSSLGIAMNDGTGTMRSPTQGLAFVGQPAVQDYNNQQLRGISQKVFSDLTNNGREDFVAITPSGLDIFLAQSDGSFRYANSIPNPFDSRQITWLKSGDLNNDGIPDIICGDGPYGADMAVLLGNGDGTFRQVQTFFAELTGYDVFNATLADVNGDGKLDVVAFLGVNGFGVFFGDGKGNLTFNANTIVPAVNNAGSEISPVLRDFNGDGKLDMVVPTSNGLQDYFGIGNGTFNPGPMIDNTDYVQILTGDLTGNGLSDLVVLSSDLRATVYLADGHGGFTKGSSLDLSVGSDNRGNTILPAELALGDFDGDGKLDLAVDYYDADSAASPPGFVEIYPGDGTGNFGSPQQVTVGHNPFTLVAIPHTPFFDAGAFNVTDHGPVANKVTATVVDGASVTIAALAADSDSDKAPLHIVGLTTPAHGVAHVDGSDNIIYAPAAGFTGADSFSYTIADPAGAQATAGVTVTTTPSAVLAFSAATYNANESDATATITLVRTGGSVGAASVTLTTSDGTAMSDTDYTATKQTVTWADGDTANKTVSIPLLNDAGTGEGAQTVNLTLSGQTPGATLGSQRTATLIISEDDGGTTQSGSLAFSAATYNANETDGTAAIILVRTGGSTGVISVTVSTSNGSAVSGADYTATTQTVSWADGDTANKSIPVPLLDDNAAGENAQTVNLSLIAPTGGATIGSQSTATLIIDEDNDSGGSGPPTPTANPDTFVLGPSGPFSGSGTTSVLANDVSNDGQPQNLTATVIVPPTAGSLTVNPNGSFTYTPAGAFQGIDRFTYQASEGATAGNTATVTLLSYHAGLVDKLYHQVLHRSAEDGGLVYWTAQLDAGKPLDVVATGIFNSTERLNPLVTQFYQQFLGRGTDPSGLAYWVADWQKKGDPRDVVENILASQEFFDDAVDTNLGYIKLLYQRVLQRLPEQSGLDYWTGLMSPPSNESRTQIASQFYDTHEKHVDLVDFLFGEYFNGVSPLPPTQPYVTDLDAGQTETQVEKAIIDSPDYNANPPEPAAGSVGRSLYPH